MFWLVALIVIGAVLGYIAGWVVWWIYGQIQLFLHVDFPYATSYPPPVLYQVAWTIFGPIALLFGLGKK